MLVTTSPWNPPELKLWWRARRRVGLNSGVYLGVTPLLAKVSLLLIHSQGINFHHSVLPVIEHRIGNAFVLQFCGGDSGPFSQFVDPFRLQYTMSSSAVARLHLGLMCWIPRLSQAFLLDLHTLALLVISNIKNFSVWLLNAES